MKRIITLLLIFLPILLQAQLEIYNRYSENDKFEPNINYFSSKKITPKIALTIFGLVEQNWSEALVGFSYSPLKTFAIGASAGIEHGTKNPRYSISLMLGKRKNSLSILGELGSGKDNYLYKINLFHKYSENFTLGLTGWRFHGFGPNFRYTIPKFPLTIWSMPAYDFETNKSRLMIGIVTPMQ
jgi:hypothetical protein